MADPLPPTRPAVDMARVAQAEAFIASHRRAYGDDSLRAQLLAAGYSEAEVALAFGRAEATGGGRPPSMRALALMAALATVNVVTFMWASVVVREPALLLAIVLLVALFELGLGYLLTARSGVQMVWALVLLAPIALCALGYGVCVLVVVR